MKQRLFYIALFINILSLRSIAQVGKYHPMPTSNARWNEGGHYYPDAPFSATYLIDGDTVINSISYHKIQRIGYQYYGYNEYYGAFREDTLSRKVYFIRPKDTTEKLLYNFAAQIGDTLKSFTSPNYIVVKEIDSIKIGLSFRKRWVLSGRNTDAVIIEGIGSSYGLFGILAPVIEGHNYLYCFSQDGKTLYPNYNETRECVIVNSVPAEKGNQILEVFPNPSNGIFKIHTNEKQFHLKLYNTLGNLICDFDSQEEVDISSLQKGLYLLNFNTEGMSTTIKLLKNE